MTTKTTNAEQAHDSTDADIATATEALKTAEAQHARARHGALEHPDVATAEAQVQAAHTAYRDAQRQQRRADIDAAERRDRIVLAALAERAETIAAVESRLAADRAELHRLQVEHDDLTLRIADLTPKGRRRVIVDFQADLAPDVPPAALALLPPAAWQQVFRDARARRAASAIVFVNEIHGVLAGAEFHPAK